MPPRALVAPLIPAAVALTACQYSSDVDFTPEEWAQVQRLSPLPEVPADPTNEYADNPAAAELGQRLFFEKDWGGTIQETSLRGQKDDPFTQSCATCHLKPAFDDRATDHDINVGLGSKWLKHNVAPLANASFYKWGGWTGSFDSQWLTPLRVFENDVFHSTRLDVVRVIKERHRDDYEVVFGALEPALDGLPQSGKPHDPSRIWEDDMSEADRYLANRVFVNVGKAIAAYCRLLVRRDAPFDRFVAGDEDAISRSAKRGLKLFIGKAGCQQCHDNPHFSDDAFHVIGIPQTGAHVPATDLGRSSKVVADLVGSDFNGGKPPFSDDVNAGQEKLLALPPSLEGAFRTAGLRNVAETAPYMHAGQFATLREVVEAYNWGQDEAPVGRKDPRIQPLGLSDSEVDDLVHFLATLTGQPLPEELITNPAESAP